MAIEYSSFPQYVNWELPDSVWQLSWTIGWSSRSLFSPHNIKIFVWPREVKKSRKQPLNLDILFPQCSLFPQYVNWELPDTVWHTCPPSPPSPPPSSLDVWTEVGQQSDSHSISPTLTQPPPSKLHLSLPDLSILLQHEYLSISTHLLEISSPTHKPSIGFFSFNFFFNW